MKTNQTKYVIRATYYYYAGTFYAPENGNLREQYGDLLIFNNREDSEKYLTEMGCGENEDGSFTAAGTYRTAHGEYARPVYRIRKVTL